MTSTTPVFTPTSVKFNNSTVRIITRDDDSTWIMGRDFVKAVGVAWYVYGLKAIHKDRKEILTIYNGQQNVEVWFLSVDGIRDFSARSKKIDSRKVCKWLDDLEKPEENVNRITIDESEYQEIIEPEVDTTELVVLSEKVIPVTTSLRVKAAFGKLHKDVVRKIETLECSKGFTERNFTPSEYKDSSGKLNKMYEMTRDGFFFLAMGFTGSRAAKFKEEFINAFNTMEAKLKEQSKKEATLNPEHLAKTFYKICRSVGLYPNASQKIAVQGTMEFCGVDTTNSLPVPEPTSQIDYKPIPKQLRRIRQDKEITQRSLSLSLFNNCDIYGKMERGIEPITERQLEMIMNALGIGKGDLKLFTPENDLIIPGKVFMFIPGLRKYFEIVNTASEIDGKITREMGKFAGAQMFEACI